MDVSALRSCLIKISPNIVGIMFCEFRGSGHIPFVKTTNIQILWFLINGTLGGIIILQILHVVLS